MCSKVLIATLNRPDSLMIKKIWYKKSGQHFFVLKFSAVTKWMGDR